MGAIFIGEFPVLSFVNVLALLVIFYIALIVNTLFIIVIGLFSFIIEDSVPMYWLYSKFTLICGALFPIEFFPMALQPIIKYSPVFVVSYGPAKLFVDFSLSMFLKVISAQIIYLLICFIIVHLIYRKGVRRINVNGG